ncbi:outer membrane lipoprotein chaperone LolA [Dokdonella sp. MW10]|uniref:outer membrane lipoprotein chaperone LolA n=1 Tax=Dokdonella sp. MW10 TaxID=2992926 RepID=UPI003F80F638
MIRSLLIVSLLMPSFAVAADGARARMEAFSKDLNAVSATFEQTVTGAKGTTGDAAKGTLALQAPRQFRWETTSPYQQLIVADGARVWVYDPDLEQVTVRNQSFEEAHSPLTVLTDLSQLDREFTASEGGERDGFTWLRLVSKAEEPDFAFAELGFAREGLARMRFEDQLGNVTEIRFSEWKRNPKLAADAFRFAAPPGVDVIGDVGDDAEVFPVKD